MKSLFAILFISSALLSNEIENFFNASKDNFVICRAGYETYVLVSPANSSIVSINRIKYFRYKNEDYYFPLAECKAVEEHDQGIIF